MRYMQEMSFQESDMMVDCISESRDVITGTTDEMAKEQEELRETQRSLCKKHFVECYMYM